MAQLKHLELFNITDGNVTHLAGNQDWYAELWHQRAGCGPTNSANVLWYLSQTRPGLRALCPYDGGTRQGFVELMDATWHYVTPGRRGVNTTKIFTDGVMRYAGDIGVALRCDVLEIPYQVAKRPDADSMLAFIDDALRQDLPVAFLNLSNGVLDNLDSWHWVTLISADTDAGTATMLDQGNKCELDMKKWLETTVFGGGFVVVKPATEA